MDDLAQRLLLTIPIEALCSLIPRKNTTLDITNKNGVISQFDEFGLHLGNPKMSMSLCPRELWTFHGNFLSWEMMILVFYHMRKESLQTQPEELPKSQGRQAYQKAQVASGKHLEVAVEKALSGCTSFHGSVCG
jgi:hypothetical protein